jgi:hypothetical protein
MAEQTTNSCDNIWGAKAIAPVVGRTERQTFYLLEKGLIPAKKIGNTWVASRRQLQALASDGEAA